MDNDKSYFEIKEWGELWYPIVKRKKGTAKIDECPFCGETHLHSKGEGFRHARCTEEHGYLKDIKIKGHVVAKVRGYFIEEY
ncbi:MAG: hypothetical protein ACHQNT_08845 [Bacteroidia bacterium]